MKNVRVRKAQLEGTLTANRETHIKDFEITYAKFSERVRENLEAKLAALKSGRKPTQQDLWINLEVPEDHTADYDRALEMLDWEVGDEVELSEGEFRQYVQNKWTWSESVSVSNKLYTGSASPSANRLPGR